MPTALAPVVGESQRQAALNAASSTGLPGLIGWVKQKTGPERLARRAIGAEIVCLPPAGLDLGPKRRCCPCKGSGLLDRTAVSGAAETTYRRLCLQGVDPLTAWRESDDQHPIELCPPCAGLGYVPAP